jgi:cytochrome c
MMDSFELNKLIGAFLAVVFVVFSVSLASDTIFASHAPETPGFAIEVAEDTSGAGGAPAEAGPSIAELLQNANAEAGAGVFRACAACHTVDKGGANKVGPNLWDIVNRPIAGHEGFTYSAAMREFAQGGSVVWDYEHLSGFLQAPRSYISGTAMAFAGIRKPEQEADLIAYLRSLSDNPAPLPEVAAAPAAEEAAPAAEGAAPAADAPAAQEAAPAEQPAAPAEQPAPAQPTTTDNGTSASPETNQGTEAPAQQPAAQ